MTPEQIKPGHTYQCCGQRRWRVDSIDAGEVSASPADDLGGVPMLASIATFALYAVRDITPAPESDQGEKVAQAQSQGAYRGDGGADLTADDWLQIEMAAKGCVSGTSDEWPALAAAIAKLRGKPFVRRVSSAWLEGFCMGAMSMRRTPPAADAVKGDLLAVVRRFVAEWDATWVDPNDINHDWAELYSQARAAIARAEAGQ